MAAVIARPTHGYQGSLDSSTIAEWDRTSSAATSVGGDPISSTVSVRNRSPSTELWDVPEITAWMSSRRAGWWSPTSAG